MCVWGLAQCIGERIRQAIACLCFIACAGPILIIIGCVGLAAHNNRDARIASWTTAIANFNSAVRPSVLGTNAALNGVNMSLTKSTVNVQGSQENVPQAVTSLAFTANSAPATTWSFATSINGSAASNVTASGTSLTTTVKTNVYCTFSYCTSNCGGSSSNYYCRNIATYACNDGVYSGMSTCYGDDGVCGTCTRDQYLSSVCVPMALSGAAASGNGATGQSWTLSPTKRSCTYPFTSQQQYARSYASSIPVKLMSDQDPYITLSEITSGDSDFGITAATQHKMGSSLLVVGIIISVVIYGIIGAVVYRFCYRNPSQNFSGDAGYVPMPQPQPVYGQPAYGQPAYGTYGQPGVAPYPAPMQQQMQYAVPQQQQQYPQQPAYAYRG